MSRGQQGQIFNQASGENSTYNADAKTSFDATNKDIGSYASAVGGFNAANPYVAGGAVQTADNQQMADTASGLAESAGQGVQAAAVRTGQNAGGAIAATEEMNRQNERALVGQEATATKDRAAADTGYRAAGLEGVAKVQGMQDQVAAQQAGAAQGALGTAEGAAQTPSFMDELGTGLIKAGDNAAYAACPAQGSLYLMADGTDKAVETLRVGEMLMGIDGEPELIEEIQSSRSSILRVETHDGFVSRSSPVHAFAQPIGGFVVAAYSMGKTILTATGRGTVVRVEWAGEEMVYNVITDGSHTYRADGLWALGVGEAERHVSMKTWDQVGQRMAQEAVGDGGR